MKLSEVKSFLDDHIEKYNHSSFILDDPVSIPHQFGKKEDIEIIGFIVATIAWGNRKSIIKNGQKLMEIMEGRPHEFILNYESQSQIEFVHRTFNAVDLDYFFRALKRIYSDYGGLEYAFNKDLETKEMISSFRQLFLKTPHERRSEKHLANPLKGSSAKRINMFLRWMIRQDKKGVDFGIWKHHKMSQLYVPLDVHTGNSARLLGLIKRKQNDWRALEELMSHLSNFNPKDPCIYDYALFGISANKVLTG